MLEAGPQQRTHISSAAASEPKKTKRLNAYRSLHHSKVTVITQSFEQLQQSGDIKAELLRRGV
jgi:hypothetical protein